VIISSSKRALFYGVISTRFVIKEHIKEDLRVTDITKIKDYQTEWWEHVERMEDQRM